MIRSLVIESGAGKTQEVRGYFDFLSLPSKGDRISLENRQGSTDVLEVSHVEHRPMSAWRDDQKLKGAMTTLFVKRAD
jgi:hypothetical protein